MKNIFFVIVFCLPMYLVAQPKFNLGIKGGVNFSKLSLNVEDYSTESVTKSHLGIFTRVGWNRVFIQPELYFSGKGGDLTSNVGSTLTSFDYNTFDVPVLLGFQLIKAKVVDIHVLAGPVISNMVKNDITDGSIYNESFYKNRYISMQYGLGVDVMFFNIGARMESGLGSIYKQNSKNFKNNAFMLSVGFKIL